MHKTSIFSFPTPVATFAKSPKPAMLASLILLACCNTGLLAQGTGAPDKMPALPAATAALPVGKSLLPNDNFSLATKDPKWPDDWPHSEQMTWEKEGDIHFLRFKSSTPGKMIMAYRQLVVPTPLPPALELRIRVRYEDVVVGAKPWFDARVMFSFKDKAGNVIKSGPPKPQAGAPTFHGTSKGQWVDRSILLRVPENAYLLEVMPCLFQVAQGTLDLAECGVFAATEDKLPAPLPMVQSQTIVPEKSEKLPHELHVAGNQLQTPEGTVAWLQGLCVDSMQWSGGGEHILQSIPVAIDQWHANAIRLPVKEDFWFGWGPWQKKGNNGMTYRKLVDDAIQAAASRGAYLILDLHRFGAPTDMHVAFWKDAAMRYKNNPAVIFELFNEPHDISWKVWRDGGNLNGAENKVADVNVKENKEEMSGEQTPGMQALVDAVRSTGAKNLIIAGGLDWGYDLSGVVKDFALHDQPGANGIMYSSHIYPWKKDWQTNTLDAAAKYPIFVGEVGNPSSWDEFKFIPQNQRYEAVGVESLWPPDMIGLIQKYKLNWTGFSFHPKCGPCVILDWNYTPTPYWGTYVKEALAGKQFDLKRLR